MVIGVPYDIVTRQPGFVAVSVVSAWVYVRGWRNFRRNRAATGQAAPGNPAGQAAARKD
jgi:hypothetical protein